MVVRFDVVPTLFAVVAILLVARPVAPGVAAALGLTVKLWPALMLFVLPRRALPRTLAAFAVIAAALVAAFALLTDDSLSFLANQQARGLQVESVGALPYELFSLIGGDVAFGLKYGSIQVLMSGAETVGLALTVLGLALFALLGWWRLSGRLESTSRPATSPSRSCWSPSPRAASTRPSSTSGSSASPRSCSSIRGPGCGDRPLIVVVVAGSSPRSCTRGRPPSS